MKALNHQQACLRIYVQAHGLADQSDRAVWDRLIIDTQSQVRLVAEALQLRYGVNA